MANITLDLDENIVSTCAGAYRFGSLDGYWIFNGKQVNINMQEQQSCYQGKVKSKATHSLIEK